jgi:putative transcriptional regulator
MERKKFNRIKAVLAETDTLNKDVAEDLKVAEETVSRWVSNSAQPSIERLFQIAEFLKVDVRTLLVSNLKAKDT